MIKHKNTKLFKVKKARPNDDTITPQMFIEYCDGGALDSIIVDLEKGLTEKQVGGPRCQLLSLRKLLQLYFKNTYF